MAMVLLLLLAGTAFKRELFDHRDRCSCDRHDGSAALPAGRRRVAGSIASPGHCYLQNSFDAGFLWRRDSDWTGTKAPRHRFAKA